MSNNPDGGGAWIEISSRLNGEISLRGLGYVKGEETPTCRGQNKEIIRDDETERGQGRVHFFKGL